MVGFVFSGMKETERSLQCLSTISGCVDSTEMILFLSVQLCQITHNNFSSNIATFTSGILKRFIFWHSYFLSVNGPAETSSSNMTGSVHILITSNVPYNSLYCPHHYANIVPHPVMNKLKMSGKTKSIAIHLKQ